ncbi:MAG: DUF5915 domain-containing protein [Polyangiaceae bacterium]
MARDPLAGASSDAFRWLLLRAEPPWTNATLALERARAPKETLIRLRNVYSFFVIYASIDEFDPLDGKSPAPAARKNELDRWILDLLQETTAQMGEKLDAYDVFGATKHVIEFVDALSNWYVRRSRDRFWRSGWDDDKRAAYATLYEALVQTSKLMAPFTPFMGESMCTRTSSSVRPPPPARAPESVHLEAFPTAARLEQRELITLMGYVRDFIREPRAPSAHQRARLKVRQRFASAHVVVPRRRGAEEARALRAGHARGAQRPRSEFVDATREHRCSSTTSSSRTSSLGERGGKEGPGPQEGEMATWRTAELSRKWWRKVSGAGAVALGTMEARAKDPELAPFAKGGLEAYGEFRAEDVLAECRPKAGFAAADGRIGSASAPGLHVAVVLETTLDDELRDLGFLRELQSRVQTARKEAGLEFSDRIHLKLRGGERLARVIEKHRGDLAKEVLATELAYVGTLDGGGIDVEGEAVGVEIAKA